MKNQPALWLLVSAVLTLSCTKQTLETSVAETVRPSSQAPSSTQVLDISFADITIDTAQIHTFVVPEITQSIVDSGYVSAMALSPADEAQVWQPLPIISSCSQRLEITSVSVGRVTVRNDLGTPVTMSYRFDVVASN